MKNYYSRKLTMFAVFQIFWMDLSVATHLFLLSVNSLWDRKRDDLNSLLLDNVEHVYKLVQRAPKSKCIAISLHFDNMLQISICNLKP